MARWRGQEKVGCLCLAELQSQNIEAPRTICVISQELLSLEGTFDASGFVAIMAQEPSVVTVLTAGQRYLSISHYRIENPQAPVTVCPCIHGSLALQDKGPVVPILTLNTTQFRPVHSGPRPSAKHKTEENTNLMPERRISSLN